VTETPPDTTTDALWGGALVLEQPARGHGYRFNVDALWLTRACACAAVTEHAIDLGAGVGAIGLSLLFLSIARRVSLVERDPSAAALLRSNAAPFRDRAIVFESDAARPDLAIDPAPLVVCNPPYFLEPTGPVAIEARRAEARSGHPAVFMDATARLLSRDGLARWIYPATGLPLVLVEAARVGLSARTVRFVHPAPCRPARVVLIELTRNEPDARAPLVQAPWYERSDDGAPDPRMTRFIATGRLE
jgi:tRNA1Val (adenine37-N6)-methyltransferase